MGFSWLVVIVISGNDNVQHDDYYDGEVSGYDGVEPDSTIDIPRPGEIVAVNNCSKAYLEIMRNHFGCKRGSFYHCNRGLEYDISNVRILHPKVISGHHAT